METSISLKKLSSGNIELNSTGTDDELVMLIVESMVRDFKTAHIIFAAIPSALDALNLDRGRWCALILNNQKNKK